MPVKNIQVIDSADNATFSIFQATEGEFSAIFPNGQDIELSEDFHEQVGEKRGRIILGSVWERPILKRDANGVHGTIYYNWESKRQYLPASKREVDGDEFAINDAQRRLFRDARNSR
jgi:hypothetical protein